MRGYKLYDLPGEDSDESSDPVAAMRAKVREEMVNKLAEEWNAVHSRIERQFFMRGEIGYEDGYEDELDSYLDEVAHQAICKDPSLTEERLAEIVGDAKREFRSSAEKRDEEQRLRLSVIEELLGDLGARMMRPYEHWNEDERLIQYLEDRYNDEY